MKSIPKIARPLAALIIFSASRISIHAQTDEAPDKEGGAKKSQASEKSGDPNSLLEKAVTAMNTLESFHVSGTFTAGGGTATLTADASSGSMDMQVKGFDKKTTFRRGIGGQFYISQDSGKTWQEDPEPKMTGFLSAIIVAPLGAESKVWKQGTFKLIAEEKIGKEDVLHIQMPKDEDSAAMDFWLAKDENLGLVVRKVSLTIEADDGEFPVVMTYTKLNQPVKIEAPAIKGPGKDEK